MPSAIAPAADVPPATEGADASTDKSIVATVQRGLNSLGFLHGEISGIADEATSKAVRNFEVYYNYDVTGKISKGLVNLLQQAGAVI
jgi:peptidoglycan hydrolase-like protein with peptidoglycan-binding domain